MFNTWFVSQPRHKVNKLQFILEVGGVVNKPRLQVLIDPGEPLVCLGLGGNE